MELEGRLEGSGCRSGETIEDTDAGDAGKSGREIKAGETEQSSDSGRPDHDSRTPDQLQSASNLSSTGVEMPYLADLAGCVRRQSDSHPDPVCFNAATASSSRRPNDGEGKTWPVQ